MKLDFIPLTQLSISKANMRYAARAPDVSDLLPTVRKRGVIVPVLVRPVARSNDKDAPAFEIVAGARRFTAARIVAEERGASEGGGEGAPDPLPCAILDVGDDADAIEASLIENTARLDADEVTRCETFTKLVKEGRNIDDIAATFGLPELGVKRILALGNLLPRIRHLYRDGRIDAVTVRHLTLASKGQQRSWLALHDDADTWCPTGHQLKAWLMGGQSIRLEHALFDAEASGLAIVADLFGEERYFADAERFWAAQDAAIATRRAAYLGEGWSDVVVVPRDEYFQSWEHCKAPKRKGGRVYLDVRDTGEVVVHEGYVTAKEAQRLDKGEALEPSVKPVRPEVSGPLQGYIDLHRHAACRAALTGHPGVALRLMVAHAITGSPLWHVRLEPQSARSDAVRESVECSKGEADFDEKRRAVLAVLGFSPEEPTVTGGVGDGHGLVGVFLRLMVLTDDDLGPVIAVVMGETLALANAVIEAVGHEVSIDMATYWQADDAFFELLRDRDVLSAIVADIAGEDVAAANAKEKGKVLKQIAHDHLEGTNGRRKTEAWVPRWMAFPPSAYTARGGVGTVMAHARAQAVRGDVAGPQSEDCPTSSVDADTGGEPERRAA